MYTAVFRMFNRTVRSGSLIQHFVVNLTDTTASRCTVSVASDILWGEFYGSGAKSVYVKGLQKYAVGSPEKGVMVPENKAR
jgi:CRISPR/Cas system-associated protein Csm6